MKFERMIDQLREIKKTVKDKSIQLLHALKLINAEKNIKDIEPLFRGVSMDRLSGVPERSDQLGMGNYPQGTALPMVVGISMSRILHSTYPDEITLEDGTKQRTDKTNHIEQLLLDFAVATGSAKGFRAEKTANVLQTWKPSSRPLDMEPFGEDEDDVVYEDDEEEDESNKKRK